MTLVTGATGKVGNEVVAQLVAKGAPVRALVRSPEKAKGWEGVEIAKGDLSDAASIEAALRGADKLFLLTSANPTQETLVIDLARQASVKLVVKLSSLGADPASVIGIGRAHAAVEAHLKSSGMAWTILRPGMFAQNFFAHAPTIRGQGRLFGTYGQGKAAPIDVRDIAQVAVHALTEEGHQGKTYALTGPAALTHAEIAAKFSAVLGKEVTYVDVPPEVTRKALEEVRAKTGMPASMVDDLMAMQKIVAEGRSATVSPDFERVTGHPPRPFDDFVSAAAASFR